MEKDFWLKKWIDNDIRFHQSSFHISLEKFGHRFSKGTIFVPLCGKSLDMIYLVQKGHKVIGAELSLLACRDFFIENKIPFTEKKEAEFTIFSSSHVTLYGGDFFKLPSSIWDEITGVYDRAALIALPPDVRKKYAAEFSKAKNKLETLLIALQYDQSVTSGPPFSVPEEEVRELFKEQVIEKLSSLKEEKYLKDHPTLKSVELDEVTYWMTRSQ